MNPPNTDGQSADAVPATFLLVDPNELPEDWRSRGRPMTLVVIATSDLMTLLGNAPTPEAMSPQGALMTMIVAGDTQDTMARRLDCSLRTVQRRLATLRDAFGVRTTHELAVELAKRGIR